MRRIDPERERRIIELYRQVLSVRGVAEEFHISSTCVHSILVRNNERRRRAGRPEMYSKKDFSGDPREEATMLGFIEDCVAKNCGNMIYIAATSSHPAETMLFNDRFERYGHVGVYPVFKRQFSSYQWHMYVYLNDMFEFLLRYKKDPLRFIAEEIEDGYEIVCIGSLTDVKGWVGIALDKAHPVVILSVSNNNRQLLEFTQRTIGGGMGRNNNGHQLVVRGEEAVEALRILPIAHAEKVASKELILHHADGGSIGMEALSAYRDLRRRIDEEVRLYTMQARLEWIRRHGKPHQYDSDQTITQN